MATLRLTSIERTYLARAKDGGLDLSFTPEKKAKHYRPIINNLVDKGLLRRAEIEGEDDIELYEITEAGTQAAK